MKPYVTGLKHFWDPVLETEYNSFASQSDDKHTAWLGDKASQISRGTPATKCADRSQS